MYVRFCPKYIAFWQSEIPLICTETGNLLIAKLVREEWRLCCSGILQKIEFFKNFYLRVWWQ